MEEPPPHKYPDYLSVALFVFGYVKFHHKYKERNVETQPKTNSPWVTSAGHMQMFHTRTKPEKGFWLLTEPLDESQPSSRMWTSAERRSLTLTFLLLYLKWLFLWFKIKKPNKNHPGVPQGSLLVPLCLYIVHVFIGIIGFLTWLTRLFPPTSMVWAFTSPLLRGLFFLLLMNSETRSVR